MFYLRFIPSLGTMEASISEALLAPWSLSFYRTKDHRQMQEPEGSLQLSFGPEAAGGLKQMAVVSTGAQSETWSALYPEIRASFAPGFLLTFAFSKKSQGDDKTHLSHLSYHCS